MTVCIAAMCDGAIFGAADRMITADDIQFEPPTAKMFGITNSIAIMTAGDASYNAEIFSEVIKFVKERINSEPDNWWEVKDVADLYAKTHNVIKLKRAENRILLPLGLERNSFIEKQPLMSEKFVTNITQEMVNFEVPYVSAIITGVDSTGHHIYVVNVDEVSCWNSIGFASIGSGSRHAESQFMLSGHAWNSPLPETLLLTYTAKKRSEVAPGVGSGTDMFFIETLGSLKNIKEEALKKLDQMYKRTKRREVSNTKKANMEIRCYVDQLTQETTAQRQQTSPQGDGGKPSDNRKEIPDYAKES